MKTLPKTEKERALNYIDTLLEVAHEPFLILDKDLRVVTASDSFYQTFEVVEKNTKGEFVYDLGNKQWDIPSLKKLLEAILPKRKVFKDYEVEHDFPKIGKRVMLLNARQIDSVQLIILAFEDVTEKKTKEEKSVQYTEGLESEVQKRTKELNDRVKDLEELTEVMVGRELKMSELKKEIARIKKLKKINGNGGNNNHTPI